MAQPEQFVFYAKKIFGADEITDSDAIAVGYLLILDLPNHRLFESKSHQSEGY